MSFFIKDWFINLFDNGYFFSWDVFLGYYGNCIYYFGLDDVLK